MKLHLFVLLLIPIVHGHGGRFNLFNPFRGIIPSVQYVQVGGGDRDFEDDRRHENFHLNQLNLPSTILLTRWDTCRKRGGFYVAGKCYLFVPGTNTWAASVDVCKGMNGNLWVPDLNNHALYQEIVDATRGLTPDFFSANGQRVWVGVHNVASADVDSLGNPVINSYLLPGGVGGGNCQLLWFDNGAFTSSGVGCGDSRASVCELNI